MNVRIVPHCDYEITANIKHKNILTSSKNIRCRDDIDVIQVCCHLRV